MKQKKVKKIIPVIFAAVIVFVGFKASLVQAAPQPGGRFGAPRLLGSDFTAQTYVDHFDATLFYDLNEKSFFRYPEKDYRNLNPGGAYMKHSNMIRSGEDSGCKEAGLFCDAASINIDNPDYEYISANHPEWFVTDDAGKRITFYAFGAQFLDIDNDEYLDWLMNQWLPNDFLEDNDKFIMQDNGEIVHSLVYSRINYDSSYSTCTNPICAKYYTDEGWQNAWIKFLKKFKEKFGDQRKIIINTVVPRNSTDLNAFKNVLQYADGAFFEFLGYDNIHNGHYNPDIKRSINKSHIALSSWFRDNSKYYIPRGGQGILMLFYYKGSGTDPRYIINNNTFTLTTGVAGEEISISLTDERYNTIKKFSDFLKTKSYLGSSTTTIYDYYPSTIFANQSRSVTKTYGNSSVETNIRGQIPQDSIDYNWALFNLARSNNGKEFFWLDTVDLSDGAIRAKTYPEMFKSLGAPKEDAVEFRPNVYRREFEGAIAYVNDSDTSQQIDLPAGFSYVNSRDQVVNSPITLRTFSGLTVYKSSPQYKNADLNKDSLVNQTDFDILKTDFLKLTASLSNPRSDINSDGQCTVRDLGILMGGWK